MHSFTANSLITFSAGNHRRESEHVLSFTFSLHNNHSLTPTIGTYFTVKSFAYEILSYREICVGQIHRRPTRPKIRVGLVLHVLHGSGAYGPFPISYSVTNVTQWLT